MGVLFRQALDMVRTILFLFLMSFSPDPGSTLLPTSFASSALTDYIRDLTSEQLFSIYSKAKGKRAFTSFRFRNRSEAQSSENPKRINHAMAKLETEQKRWMQPLNLLGREALQELTTLRGGYKLQAGQQDVALLPEI